MSWETFAIEQNNKLDETRLQLIRTLTENISNLVVINKVKQLIKDTPNDQELGKSLRENFKNYLEQREK